MDQLLHTAEGVAELLSMSRATVYVLLAEGQIESVTIGRARRIPHDAVVAFIERRRADAPVVARSAYLQP